MPKLGMEPIRRTALVDATIAEIAARGSLDVTVGQIAKRAGMSTALAHHYFGGKHQIFLAAMQQILRDFGREVRRALAQAATPRARAEALIEASFAPDCFAPATISAWMTLYASAQTNPDTLRLLKIYQRRLHSNLLHALRPISTCPDRHASLIASLIDGLYLRAALSQSQSASDARDAALFALSEMLADRAPEAR